MSINNYPQTGFGKFVNKVAAICTRLVYKLFGKNYTG